MTYRAWQVNRPDEQAAAKLAAQIGAPKLLARVLTARGLDTPEKAMGLLGQDVPLTDPMRMKDMDKAVERILRAIDEEEKMVVFGDYDVDGVTATALLYSHLRNMGADVRCMLPSREGEGYGLSEKVIRSLADKGYRLIITVDNGISAGAEAELAAQLGVDLVVTDHHLPPRQLPKAVAVVDPMRTDDESPYKGFSGAGVAFKLCCALDGCPPEELLDFCGDLAAIGTVADVMDLTGENRTLVRRGLEALQNSGRPGIEALLEVSGMGGRTVTADTISYTLAPRLNAAGRMDSAALALQLLLCEDAERAADLAARLNQCNQDRQNAEQEILARVNEQLDADPARKNDRVLVVWGDAFHPGVTGIVASRLVERYGRPAIVISMQGDEGKGSGRSIEGFHLHQAISACQELLVRFGGHALAAGLSIRRENLEAFRQQINAWAAKTYPLPQQPPLRLDVPVRLDEVTVEEVQGLDYLAPCGHGNPAPLFLVENAIVDGVYPMGDGRHSRVRLRQGTAGLYLACFGVAPANIPYQPGDRVDAAVSFSVYEGRNGPMVSGRARELRPAGLGNEPARQAALYEAWRSGAHLDGQQRTLLKPERDDTVALYRQLRSGRVDANDLQPLFACMGPQQTGKTLVSLEALTELNLIAVEETEGARRYVLVPTKEKKDLASAPVLRAMMEE